ncbi:hypothetical protein PFISCL1PPCAC_20975, partial [Pristionchus fissidentatus]
MMKLFSIHNTSNHGERNKTFRSPSYRLHSMNSNTLVSRLDLISSENSLNSFSAYNNLMLFWSSKEDMHCFCSTFSLNLSASSNLAAVVN